MIAWAKLCTIGVAAALALSACSSEPAARTSSPSATSAPPATSIPRPAESPILRLSAKGNQYSPAILEGSAGKGYQLEITDVSEQHTFTVSDLGINIFVSQMGTRTSDLAVPAAATGDLPFFCSLHANMGGTLRVSDA